MNVVIAEASKAQGGHYLAWECPRTGVELWCQGEFYYNKEEQQLEHQVLEEDGSVAYKVIAKL